MSIIQENRAGFTVNLLIQPRSSKNIITGLHDGALKIKLTAPPVDDAANRMCVQFLAKKLKLPRSSLDIISGRTSRKKTVLIKYKKGTDHQTEATRLKGLIKGFIESPASTLKM